MSRHHSSHRTVHASLPSSLMWVNVVSLGAACLLLAYYIVTANKLTAVNYHIQHLEAQMSALTEDHAVLVEQKVAVEDPLLLTQFAQSRGMVKAVHPTHVVGRQGVALVR